jgi:glycosyltransferase involved in cell wall biosynthesis
VADSTSTVIAIWPWSPDEAADGLEAVRAAAPRGVDVHELDPGVGFAAALNRAAAVSGDADMAIIADACALPEDWLPRMRLAASADDTVAAATALVAGEERPLFAGFDGDSVFRGAPPSAEPGTATEPVHPRISILWPHCAYIRRAALELLDPFDVGLTHPAAVLAEFAARAFSRGLSCTLADDVLVKRIAGGLPPCGTDEMAMVARLHPWIEAARAEDDKLELGPLRRALVAARVTGRRLSVTIDARSLSGSLAGTQTHVGGLVLALAESGRVTVRAILPDGAPPRVADELIQAGAEVVSESEATGLPRSDVAHRPQQAFVPEDLRLLRGLGERVVISHLDLISYRNPTYHRSSEEWRRYRRLTRVALAAADRVVFSSEHARRDAISEDLIEPIWTAVTGVGISPQPEDPPVRQPERVPPGRELLVMVGSDYLHKNRLFALELVDELGRRHGWDGLLVLAGAHVPNGGSAGLEAELLAGRPALAERVLDLGPVDEAEKHWLLRHAQALLCPSTYEGFGFVPLEAAAAGLPCIYAATTSLREVVGPDAATIVPWDAAISADRARSLLFAGEERQRHLTLIRDAMRRYRWDSAVDGVVDVYHEAIASLYRSSVPRAWEELEREQLIVELDRGYHELHDRVEHGLPLIDRGGLLTLEQQRGLMRIASRPWLRSALLGPVGLLGGMRADNRGPSSR